MEDPLPVGPPPTNEDHPKKEPKTVFSILSNLPDSGPPVESAQFGSKSDDDNDDIVILRTDPKTRLSTINKNAYLKLHRSLSPGARNSIDKIKEKYENDDDAKPKISLKRTPALKLDQDAIKSLKEKYSPASYGYSQPELRNGSKLPIPKPRRSIKSQIIISNKEKIEHKPRLSLNIEKKAKDKDENSNLVRNDTSSSEECLIPIVRRSESEESVDKFEKELSYFTMEKPSKKKRSNSFKKIFSGKLFGKDKKKKEEDKSKSQNKENGSCVDNIQNETNSFSRQSSYRHTTGGQVTRQTELPQRSNSVNNRQQQVPYDEDINKRYAQMHINQFNQIKHNFEAQNATHQPQQLGLGYVAMDKPIFKCNQPTYMNMPNIRHIDTSSSTSTAESDRSNLYQNEVLASVHREQNQQNLVTFKNDSNIYNSGRYREVNSRDTPPRADETRCDVKLVNPKALIPINSERPLPNPYQNDKNSMERENSSENKKNETTEVQPRLEETYGIVLDSIERKTSPTSPKIVHKPPKSPSLEPTKLKLPPNRDIIPLSPRIRSPIPKDDISTEKIIATELLKPSRSPTPTKKSTRQSSPSHQRLAEIDYPSDLNINRFEEKIESLSAKPPPAQQKPLQKKMIQDEKRMSQASPASCDSLPKSVSQPSPLSHDKVTTNAMVHVNSTIDRTPTPNSLLDRSMSPIRPASIRSSTPVDGRISQSPKSTPQKEDMRRSVEAYYWKEIKKLKDQETQDLYRYHLQHNMIPYGYAEDPISVRRSRSLSPSAYRNSRRSLSLPRDPRPAQVNVPQEIPENPYGRLQQDAIPEGRAVVNLQRNVAAYPNVSFQQNFRRNTPERRTVDSSNGSRNYDNFTPNGNNSLYRPIFKRGSLNEPPRTVVDEPGNKKVSFTSSNQQPWPTRNGYVNSPPQRRIDRKESIMEDDVFIPSESLNTSGNDSFGYPKVVQVNNMRYNVGNEELYYNSRQNLNREALYASRNPSAYLKGQNGTIYDGRKYPVEETYGQPLDAIRAPQRLARHGSINMDPNYGQRIPRRASFDVRTNRPDGQYVTRPGPRREIIEQDEIFGRFGGYLPNETVYRPQPTNHYLQSRQQPGSVYSSRQSVAESLYGGRYPQKQVTMNTKVCDYFGQIHDKEPSRPIQSGVLVGQLNRTPASPVVTRQSYNNLPATEQFVRNTRLTASANDMYRRAQANQDGRYGHVDQYGGAFRPQSNGVGQYGDATRAFNPQSVQYDAYGQQGANGAPTRPLPPVPHGKKRLMRGNSTISDTESGSDASEIRRIMEGNAKTKKKGFFGK